MALKPKSALHERWKGLSSCGPAVNSFEYSSLPAEDANIKINSDWLPLCVSKRIFQPPVTLKLQNFFAFCFLTRLNPREVSSLWQNPGIMNCELCNRPVYHQVEKWNESRMQTSSSDPASLHEMVLFDSMVSKLSYALNSVSLNTTIKTYKLMKLLCAVLPLQILVRAPYRRHNILQP